MKKEIEYQGLYIDKAKKAIADIGLKGENAIKLAVNNPI